jgi:hypothetical protein
MYWTSITASAVAVFVAFTAAPKAAGAEPLQFTPDDMVRWERRNFKAATDYRIVTDAGRGRPVIRASASGTASGLFRNVRIDLDKTPYLSFSWNVSDVYAGIDERTKAGDDFPARVYVVIERGIGGLRSLSLNYVWSNTGAPGDLWPSPYTSQVKLLALDAGPARTGRWISHKRNVKADLRRAFGEEITSIGAVAIMTDADNFGGRTVTLYGDLSFSAE